MSTISRHKDPRRLSIGLLVPLLLTACTGDTPATQSPDVFSGTVLDAATELPVSGAEILLYEDRAPFPEVFVPEPFRSDMPGADVSATSDANGRFAITLDDGTYGVGVSADGYVRHELGAPAAGLPGTRLTIDDGVVEPVEIRLTPGGQVTGGVLDVDGQPAESVAVLLLLPFSLMDGTRHLVIEAEARTDETGRYRIDRVPPGRYLVAAGKGTGPFGFAANPLRSADGRQYGRSYWPGVDEPELAESIDVAAGSTTDVGDLVIAPETLRRVRGRIVDTNFDAPPPAAVVTVHSRTLLQFVDLTYETADYDPETGVFEVDLADGVYRIGVSVGEDPIGPEYRERRMRPRDAWVPLEVGSQEIRDLLIPVPATGSLRGQIILSNREPFGSIAGRSGGAVPGVVLEPLDPLQQSAVIQPITIDGSFEVPNVVFGEYRVRYRVGPHLLDYFVESVSLNGATSDSMLIDIPPDRDNSLIIRLRPDGGTIDLNVVDADGIAVPNATILLLPDPVPQPIGFHQLASSDPLGRSVLRRVPPGNYRLLAWLDVARSGFPAPDVYQDAGVTVEVLEGATVTLQVEPADLTTLER